MYKVKVKITMVQTGAINKAKNEVFMGLSTEYFYLVGEINLKLMFASLENLLLILTWKLVQRDKTHTKKPSNSVG